MHTLTGTDTTPKSVYIETPGGLLLGKVFASEKEVFDQLKATPGVGVVRAKRRTEFGVSLVVYR